MRIAIYTRLSPNPEKDDTESQLRDLVKYAKDREWTIVKQYSDIHVSGSKKGKDRPQFAKMMEDAYKKEFDLLLFWSLDRLSREGVAETISYLNQLTDAGVGYRSYTEQYFDSCGIFKDVVIAVMATVAKQERVRLVERTKAGLALARARGKILGRPKTRVDSNVLAQLRSKGMTLEEIAAKYTYRDSKDRIRRVSYSTVSRLLTKREKELGK